MTSRRGFLLGLTTALAAPAVVRAESLMKLWVPPAPKLITAFDAAAAGSDISVGDWVMFVRESRKWARAFNGSKLRGLPEGIVVAKEPEGPVVMREGFFVLPQNPPDGMQIVVRAT
jgi:hypothetical protein